MLKAIAQPALISRQARERTVIMIIKRTDKTKTCRTQNTKHTWIFAAILREQTTVEAASHECQLNRHAAGHWSWL